MYQLVTDKYPYYQFKKAVKKSKGTILFIHGYAVNSNYHNYFSDRLDDYDYIAIELAGHGITPLKSKKQLSPISYANEIINLIKEVNLKKIYLVGHSMGGGIAVLISQIIPDLIKKMVIVTPMNSFGTFNIFDFLFKFNPTKNSQIPSYYKILMYDYNNNKHRISQEMVNNIIETNIKFRKNFRHLKYKIASIKNIYALSKNEYDLKIPTLLIVGKGDSCINHKTTIRNFSKKNQQNNNLKTYTFTKSGHIPFFEEPELYYQVIMKFLNEEK